MTSDDSYTVCLHACEAIAIQADVERERLRPFMLLKPSMSRSGDIWCALYGDSILNGVTGYGDTPEKAAIQFDIEWLNGSTISGNNHE